MPSSPKCAEKWGMTENIKLKNASPLVQSVVALDEHFAALERIGAKIQDAELKTDFDIQQARKFMAVFTEHGQGIATEVVRLSQELNVLRERAAQISEKVAARSVEISHRDDEEHTKMEQFRVLAEKVRGVNAQISQLRPAEGAIVTDDDRKRIYASLIDFETQLEPLIQEAQSLKNEGHQLKMKSLEQNADSLAQTLLSVRQKVRGLAPNFPLN